MTKKPKLCAQGSHGWGDKNCTNPVDSKVSRYWCPTCEKERRAHITRGLEMMSASLRASPSGDGK